MSVSESLNLCEKLVMNAPSTYPTTNVNTKTKVKALDEVNVKRVLAPKWAGFLATQLILFAAGVCSNWKLY